MVKYGKIKIFPLGGRKNKKNCERGYSTKYTKASFKEKSEKKSIASPSYRGGFKHGKTKISVENLTRFEEFDNLFITHISLGGKTLERPLYCHFLTSWWSFFMKNAVVGFKDSISRINSDITRLNQSMADYAKDMRKMAKESPIPKPTRRNDFSGRIEREARPMVALPSASGIDYRRNPVFLQVANFFGVNQREYPLAVNKVAEIIDWAAQEVGSNNISEILSKISTTSKGLRSSGYNERPYAVLYRYIKLASDKKTLDKATQSSPEQKQQVKQDQKDIKKEMQAYEA